MSRIYVPFLLLAVTLFTIGAAGCLSTTFQEVTYGEGGLEVGVENSGDPVKDAVLQVTVMRVERFEQTEVYCKARYVNLGHGLNIYTFPVELQPGSYKLFLIAFVGDERRASVIRSLKVVP